MAKIYEWLQSIFFYDCIMYIELNWIMIISTEMYYRELIRFFFFNSSFKNQFFKIKI